MRLALALLLGMPGLAAAGACAADQPVGSWLLVCHGGADGCVLRHRKADLRLGSLRAALGVRPVGGALVPVVALHGLSAEAAMVGSLSVGLRFDRGAWIEMDCPGLSVCAPGTDSLAAAAEALPAARSVTLRVELTLPQVAALPQPEVTFRLLGTAQALRRLRQAGPMEATVPAEPGLDLRGLMGKVLGGG